MGLCVQPFLPCLCAQDTRFSQGLERRQGGGPENKGHLMLLGAGQIMRCRHEPRGLFEVQLPPSWH